MSEERQLEAAGGLRTQADREAFWARMFDFVYPRPGLPIPERPSLEYRTTKTSESHGGGGDAPLPQIHTPSHSLNQTPEKRASMMLMRRTTEGTTLGTPLGAYSSLFNLHITTFDAFCLRRHRERVGGGGGGTQSEENSEDARRLQSVPFSHLFF